MSGLATALSLQRHGFNVQIYEKNPALCALGIGLTLTPDGLSHLEAIQPGMIGLLEQTGSKLHRIILSDRTGETLASKSIDKERSLFTIQESRLQAILASALPSNAIQFRHRCVGYEPLNNQVKLFFANGETVETDLLIGADGINSAVRQTLISDGFPNFTDHVWWGAVVQFEHKQLHPNTSLLFNGTDGERFSLFNVGEGYTFWSASIRSIDDFSNQRGISPKNRVLKRFFDWTDPIGAIVAATPEEAILETPLCDRFSLQRWSQGRVTLIGDAAHPILPALEQGVNVIIEDAHKLADCLATASDVETALKAYDNRRILHGVSEKLTPLVCLEKR